MLVSPSSFDAPDLPTFFQFLPFSPPMRSWGIYPKITPASNPNKQWVTYLIQFIWSDTWIHPLNHSSESLIWSNSSDPTPKSDPWITPDPIHLIRYLNPTPESLIWSTFTENPRAKRLRRGSVQGSVQGSVNFPPALAVRPCGTILLLFWPLEEP